MTTQPDEFESYFQAIVNDIWIVDECYDAIFFISDHYQKFRAAPFLQLFGRMQNSYFVDAMILAIGRLFDGRKDVFSVRSMIANCGQFDLINKQGFVSELRKLNVSDDVINAVEREDLSAQVAWKLRQFVPVKERFPELERVVGRRHTDVAHRGKGPKKFQQPFFSDVKVCGNMAKQWITCFALGIQNHDIRNAGGAYRFSSDAKALSRQMKLLLQYLHLLPAINEHHDEMIEEFHRKHIGQLAHQGKI